MNEWPEFEEHPTYQHWGESFPDTVELTRTQYNQARDAIAEVERLRALFTA